MVLASEAESEAWVLAGSLQGDPAAPGLQPASLHQAGLPAVVPAQEGRMLFSASPLSLSTLLSNQLFVGTQILNYLLLLHLHHGSPSGV